MSIFNSLGSNYDFNFVLNALFAFDNESEELKSLLDQKYSGQSVLLYKGREAIELALKLLDLPPDSAVLINGFTCFAVDKAITDAGLKVEYLDIKESDLNFSADAFAAKLKSNPKIKVVIIQNTLGYPADVLEIAKICQEKKIILIEDLAHSVGTIYGKSEAGTVGDFTALSFSQDKMIDGISGGALIVRNKFYQEKVFPKMGNLDFAQQFKDRLYPLWTYLIRTTYQFGIGKLLHAILKKINLLSLPIDPKIKGGLHKLPNWYCGLIIQRFKNLDQDLKHRQKIAQLYAQNLDSKILISEVVKTITSSSNLRFPILVDSRNGLINYLKKYQIFVSDIWYDGPIAPKKFMHLTSYKNQCPISEEISLKIINLPTHLNVSTTDAKEICERINQWLKS